MADEQPPRLEIDWLRIAGGALAAVSSAVLLSTLGAGGTLVGAAIGSVAASLGTAVYSTGLAHSRARVRRAQDLALRKVGVAQAEVRRAGRRSDTDGAAEGHLEHADEQLREVRAELAGASEQIEAATIPWTQRLRRLNWRRVLLFAGAGFVVAAIVITVFELFAGRPVSSFTGGSDTGGGTTWSHIDGKQQRPARPQQQPTDLPTQAPSVPATPSSTPTPTYSPSESPTGEPTEQPTETPTSEPTESPTDTTTPGP